MLKCYFFAYVCSVFIVEFKRPFIFDNLDANNIVIYRFLKR